MVTDNAANMKHAFELMLEDDHEDMTNSGGGSGQDSKMDGGDCSDDDTDDVEWTTVPLTIEGWIGCNAHLVQLVGVRN